MVRLKSRPRKKRTVLLALNIIIRSLQVSTYTQSQSVPRTVPANRELKNCCLGRKPGHYPELKNRAVGKFQNHKNDKGLGEIRFLSVLFLSQKYPVAHGSGVLFKFFKQVINCKFLLFFRRIICHNCTPIHHNEAGAIFQGIPHVMSNHKGSQVLFMDNFIGNLQHFGCGLRIKCCRRFIQKKDVRLFQGSHEESQGLTLATGEETNSCSKPVFQSQIQTGHHFPEFFMIPAGKGPMIRFSSTCIPAAVPFRGS